MTDIEYDGRTLTIGPETITLRDRIVQAFEHDGTILVVLFPERQDADLRNVLAFSPDGTRLWESEVPDKPTRHLISQLRVEDGDVVGWSWNGYVYEVDVETGALTKRRYSPK